MTLVACPFFNSSSSHMQEFFVWGAVCIKVITSILLWKLLTIGLINIQFIIEVYKYL